MTFVTVRKTDGERQGQEYKQQKPMLFSIFRIQFSHHRSPCYPNTPAMQDSDLKSHLIMMTENFMKDTNNSIKEIQETRGDQLKSLKEITQGPVSKIFLALIKLFLVRLCQCLANTEVDVHSHLLDGAQSPQ